MESMLAARLYPMLVLLLVSCLAFRLGFVSGRGLGGGAWFGLGGSVTVAAARSDVASLLAGT